MILDINTAIGTAAAVVTAIGGAYPIINHLIAKKKRDKEKYRQDILDQAQEEMKKIEKSLEEKIAFLENEFQTQKQSIYKDFNFFKETHNSEIKALGEKIENLRNDLSQQHQALVGLLTKLVNNK